MGFPHSRTTGTQSVWKGTLAYASILFRNRVPKSISGQPKPLLSRAFPNKLVKMDEMLIPVRSSIAKNNSTVPPAIVRKKLGFTAVEIKEGRAYLQYYERDGEIFVRKHVEATKRK